MPRAGGVRRLLGAGTAACTSKDESKFEPKTPTVKPTRNATGTVDDHSLCDWKNKTDREASEVAGPGSISPNVRRVYQIVGTGEDRHKVLICREIDTNFDGVLNRPAIWPPPPRGRGAGRPISGHATSSGRPRTLGHAQQPACHAA